MHSLLFPFPAAFSPCGARPCLMASWMQGRTRQATYLRRWKIRQHPWPESSAGQWSASRKPQKAPLSLPEPTEKRTSCMGTACSDPPLISTCARRAHRGPGREESILTGAGPGKPPSLVPCPHPRAAGGRLGGKQGLQRCKPAGEHVTQAQPEPQGWQGHQHSLGM